MSDEPMAMTHVSIAKTTIVGNLYSQTRLYFAGYSFLDLYVHTVFMSPIAKRLSKSTNVLF